MAKVSRALVVVCVACALTRAATSSAEPTPSAEPPEAPAAPVEPIELIPEPPPPRERPIALLFHAGLGSPVGFFGAGVEIAPVSWWVIAPAVGRNDDGLQLALMTRVRWPKEGVGFGLGVSEGPFAHTDNGEGALSFRIFPSHATTRWRWDHAWWMNVELLSFETASTNVLRARFYGGIAILVNRTPTSCAQGQADSGFFGVAAGPSCSDVPGPFVYVGGAVGPGIAAW